VFLRIDKNGNCMKREVYASVNMVNNKEKGIQLFEIYLKYK
jgi:hypothetical protein